MTKFFLAFFVVTFSAFAQQPFQFPTANHTLYEKGGEEKFFVPTTGKTWVSGTFGCVRSDGHQMHEGLDIKCLQRDRHGEPIDPVMAAADGIVAYINDHPSLSNYGRYIVLFHRISGIEVYSLYAHLSQVVPGIKIGRAVRQGEQIAVMGRTSNTGERISKERAHTHFELNLFYSDHFNSWFKKTYPKEPDDHGNYNGQNLVGMDSRLILLAEKEEGSHFNLLDWIEHRPELCRVLVRKADFPYVRRYPMLIKQSSLASRESIAGYEIALDYNGLPIELIPRSASEFKGSARYQLVSVNVPEYLKNPCRSLVARHGTRWELANYSLRLLDLLTD